jgi:hypothetical protein
VKGRQDEGVISRSEPSVVICELVKLRRLACAVEEELDSYSRKSWGGRGEAAGGARGWKEEMVCDPVDVHMNVTKDDGRETADSCVKLLRHIISQPLWFENDVKVAMIAI